MADETCPRCQSASMAIEGYVVGGQHVRRLRCVVCHHAEELGSELLPEREQERH
jgi:hypothetical protein